MSEKKLSRKEKKELDAQKAREDAEWEAKYKLKIARRDVTKMIAEMQKCEAGFIQNAANARMEGYEDSYRQQIGCLKLARARIAQAKKFLYQMDAMENMKKLTDSSSKMLSTMGDIMGSLGKLTLDKEAMRNSQREFAETTKNLETQSMTIDAFLSGMEFSMPDDDSLLMGSGMTSDDAYDDEISRFIVDNNLSATNIGAKTNSASAELADLEKALMQ